MIEKVTAYRGADGKLYTDEEEAKKTFPMLAVQEILTAYNGRLRPKTEALFVLNRLIEHPDFVVEYKGRQL